MTNQNFENWLFTSFTIRNETVNRQVAQDLHKILADPMEFTETDKWFMDFSDGGKYGFETYQPETLEDLVEAQQRYCNELDAFQDFQVNVMNGATIYSNAFSGKRPKAQKGTDWFFERDPDNISNVIHSREFTNDAFRKVNYF